LAGLPALGRLIEAPPSDFPASLRVVQHLDPRHHSLVADHSRPAHFAARDRGFVAAGLLAISVWTRYCLWRGPAETE